MNHALRASAAAALFTLTGGLACAQQPDIGIAPVTLSAPVYRFDTAEQHGIEVSVLIRGINHPFALAMLPDGDALISERGGNLRWVRGATGASPELVTQPVTGAPAPAQSRGGGLHDVVPHPDYATNHLVYFSFNRLGEAGADSRRRPSSLVVARGRFENGSLAQVEELLSGPQTPGASGSRLAFAKDGTLYITTGAPFSDDAQNPANIYGKVLRINADGSIPADNPFADGRGGHPAVVSVGHRDQLGLTVDPASGAVLAAEHGPNGGDEVNRILPGQNYGWPRASFGRNYDGTQITDDPLPDGVSAPLLLWVPSIGPTGLSFYTGSKLAAWRGNLFIGSSRRGEVPRTGGLERVAFNDDLGELRRETLLTDLHQRIRDVRQGPDELLYVVTDEDDGALLRIAPTAP
ncbi:MAG: PQQ-dependent sugar dehydrogenase [Gammaproteobacteria bacterium]|nr:PQQ-dependent sugar dehydrogenase [Gammaproteobacteria bacterium]